MITQKDKIRTFGDDGKNLRATMKKRLIKARIISNKNICADHFVMELETSVLGKKSQPGQFVNVKIEDAPEQFLRVPLGIHRIRKSGISLLYKVVGKGTEHLSTKSKNDIVNLLGPLGKGFKTDKKEKKAILVSGGHGIAPLYALCKKLKKEKQKIELFVGSSTKKHLVCLKDFRKLGIKVHIATDDGSKGYKGYVTDLLDLFLDGKRPKRHTTYYIRHTSLYACGPKPMLKQVGRIAKKHRISAQVSVDEYMACGIGVCLGCAIKTVNGYKLVCKDGPVFDSEEIVWE